MEEVEPSQKFAKEIDSYISVDRRRIFQVLELIDEMQRRASTDFDSVLLEINSATVESIPGAESACVTVVDGERGTQTLAATHQYPILLDDIQRETGEGPCLSAAWTQHTIVINDLNVENRWPEYRKAAMLKTPIRSIASFRLFGEGNGLAALNLYSEKPGAFDEDSVELGLVFAAHTTIAWNTIRRHQQFSSALASRDLIGQAKGVLMERFDIDAFAAFDLLRRLSQETSTKLIDIAKRIVEREDFTD